MPPRMVAVRPSFETSPESANCDFLVVVEAGINARRASLHREHCGAYQDERHGLHLSAEKD
jgi:hypothetical protein